MEQNLSALFYDLGKWAGLIGFASLSFLIFSGDTARFFDRFFGLDKIIKFQRKFSLFTALFVILHPVFFILSDFSFFKYLFIPDFTLLPFALGTVSLYIFIIVMVFSHFYKQISHKNWQIIHILTYILFFFALYHALNWGSDSSRPFFQTLYTIIVIALITGGIFRAQYKIRKIFAGKFYIKDVRPETSDTFSITLSAPQNFKFKAGQFCFLRINKNKLNARHPFTVASAPHEKDLLFTIKNTGRFTKTAQKLKPGEEIIVDGPFGIFTLDKNKSKNVVFIAGGVGITPFSSMIRDNFYRKDKKNITLLYGSKTLNDIIFKNELDMITEPWFKKVYVLSHETQKTSEFENGFIDEEIIKKYIPSPQNCSFYICGPAVMKNSVEKTLLALGAKSKNIFIEDFFW